MTEAEQEENRFTNTVFTTGYKFKHGTAPLKSQDRHRVYGLGSYAYYQWAGHTVHLDIKTFWDDVNNVYASPDEALYEQVDQINALKTAINGDLTKLKLEITDTSGDPLKDAFNLYSGGRWSTYQNRRVYFSNADGWNKVNVYYWSHTNASMVAWPGASMELYGNDGTYDIYKLAVPTNITGMIINGVKNDGSGDRDQTPDIESGWYDGICYYMLWSDGNTTGSEPIDVILPPVCQHENTTTTTVEATCTENGSVTVTCDACGEVLSTEVIESTGHDYTYTNNGENHTVGCNN